MADIKWNPDALTKAANAAVAQRASQMQALLDSLHATERGKDVSAVKYVLASRWQQDFGVMPSDEWLTAYAEQLAAGRRIIVNAQTIPTGSL
jgi:hypothetical protein